MPLFFFDFTSDGSIEPDDIGTEFPSLEEAFLNACRTALEMSLDKLRVRSDSYLDSVEILDAHRQPLMRVPFSEVLRFLHSRQLQSQRGQIIRSCHREWTRGKRLHAEIDVELRRMRAAYSALSASLARLRSAHPKLSTASPSFD